LRKEYGPTYRNCSRRIEMNKEIYNNFKSPDIITGVQGRRFEWLGYVVRLGGERAVNRLLEGKPGGEREKGKT
jgi:hypothetical protein